MVPDLTHLASFLGCERGSSWPQDIRRPSVEKSPFPIWHAFASKVVPSR